MRPLLVTFGHYRCDLFACCRLSSEMANYIHSSRYYYGIDHDVIIIIMDRWIDGWMDGIQVPIVDTYRAIVVVCVCVCGLLLSILNFCH